MSRNPGLSNKAAMLGISLTIAASAANIDAQNIEAGRAKAYGQDDLVKTLKSLAELLDSAAGVVLELLDELNPEVAQMRKEIEDLNKMFGL